MKKIDIWRKRSRELAASGHMLPTVAPAAADETAPQLAAEHAERLAQAARAVAHEDTVPAAFYRHGD